MRKLVERRLMRAKPIAEPVEPRIAYVSPMPPAPTGIASYSRSVIRGLAQIGTLRRRHVDVLWPIEPRHEADIRSYRLGIYHVGNNVEFHGDIYRLAVTNPGLVVLHDLGLDDFVRGMVSRGDPLGYRALREAIMRAGSLTLPEARENEPLRRPWSAHIVRHARGVIVHSEFCRRYLRDVGCRTPIFVVPHPPVERDADLRRAEAFAPRLRALAGATEDDVLIVAAGDLNGAKQVGPVLEAVARLGPAARARIALVGRRIPGFDPEAVVAASGAGDRTTIAADVSDDDFRGWLHAADVVADLRHPHRGEVSGSLMRAMQVGRPTLVSATGTYLDIPEDAVVRVPAGEPDPAELAAILGGLAADPERRRAIGERARAHALAAGGLERTARGYEGAIEETLALALDPRRLALARWAKALNDLGVGDEQLDEGFGISYAAGLDELASRIEPPRRSR